MTFYVNEKTFPLRSQILFPEVRAPCNVKKYICLPHRVPHRTPNEIDYGKIFVETNSRTTVSTSRTSLTWRH